MCSKPKIWKSLKYVSNRVCEISVIWGLCRGQVVDIDGDDTERSVFIPCCVCVLLRGWGLRGFDWDRMQIHKQIKINSDE